MNGDQRTRPPSRVRIPTGNPAWLGVQWEPFQTATPQAGPLPLTGGVLLDAGVLAAGDVGPAIERLVGAFLWCRARRGLVESVGVGRAAAVSGKIIVRWWSLGQEFPSLVVYQSIRDEALKVWCLNATYAGMVLGSPIRGHDTGRAVA